MFIKYPMTSKQNCNASDLSLPKGKNGGKKEGKKRRKVGKE